jgi:hypothetical protein
LVQTWRAWVPGHETSRQIYGNIKSLTIQKTIKCFLSSKVWHRTPTRTAQCMITIQFHLVHSLNFSNGIFCLHPAGRCLCHHFLWFF